MSIFRFIILSYATEILVMPILSYFVLRRELFGHYIVAFIVAILGYLIHDLIMIDRASINANAELKIS